VTVRLAFQYIPKTCSCGTFQIFWLWDAVGVNFRRELTYILYLLIIHTYLGPSRSSSLGWKTLSFVELPCLLKGAGGNAPSSDEFRCTWYTAPQFFSIVPVDDTQLAFCDFRVEHLSHRSIRRLQPATCISDDLYIIMPCECLASIAFCPCLCIWPCCSLADCFVIPHCCPALPCIPLIPCCCAPCCPGVVDSGGSNEKSPNSGHRAPMPDNKYMPLDDTTTYKLEK